MQQFPAFSPSALGFSWWWVAAGIVLWGGIVLMYYRTFMTGVADRNAEGRQKARRLRKKQARVESIRDGLNEAVAAARLEREAAEAAAVSAEAAADGPSARRAADLAAASAKRAEDAAIAVLATANALREPWARKMLGRRGDVEVAIVEGDVAAARAAADRAGRAAGAKGAPVG